MRIKRYVTVIATQQVMQVGILPGFITTMKKYLVAYLLLGSTTIALGVVVLPVETRSLR